MTNQVEFHFDLQQKTMFKRLKQEHPLFLPFFYKLVNMQLSVGFYLISKIVMII